MPGLEALLNGFYGEHIDVLVLFLLYSFVDFFVRENVEFVLALDILYVLLHFGKVWSQGRPSLRGNN